MSRQHREVSYWDEDRGNQVLLPLASLEFCKAEIIKLKAFSDAHRAPDGEGWTDVYAIGEAPCKLAEMGITAAVLRDAFSILPAFDTVMEIPYGNTPVESVIAWGFTRANAVFAEWDPHDEPKKSENVPPIDMIWTTVFESDPDRLRMIADALHALGRKVPLIYVDWSWNFALPLDGSAELYKKLVWKTTTIAKRAR